MTSFDLNEPLLPPHAETVGMQDLNGLTKAHFQQARRRSLKRIAAAMPALSFSELDQAFYHLGLYCAGYFSCWLSFLC